MPAFYLQRLFHCQEVSWGPCPSGVRLGKSWEDTRSRQSNEVAGRPQRCSGWLGVSSHPGQL